jgi:iron-sulfur cluster repair protein YtfE (RIC family)
MSDTCTWGATQTESAQPSTRIVAEQVVAEISKRPGARRVLERLGINHRCGAHLSLCEAAAASGVPLDDLLRALDETVSAAA